jgi:hypothetical protein
MVLGICLGERPSFVEHAGSGYGLCAGGGVLGGEGSVASHVEPGAWLWVHGLLARKAFFPLSFLGCRFF